MQCCQWITFVANRHSCHCMEWLRGATKMASKAFPDWMRNSIGYVSLVPLETWAAGVTDHGDIALHLAGSCAPEDEEHCAQYVLSTRDAMHIATTLVRAVALADAQAPAVSGPVKKAS